MKHETELDKALDSITIDQLKRIEHGEEIHITKEYALYRYTEDDVYMVNEISTWTELYQVLWSEDGDITFESLT